MNYMEELFAEGYLADAPIHYQDVLLLPKGITPDCTIPLYVNRDYFVDMMRKQRRNGGMNEAILLTILSAPDKGNFSVFTILANTNSLMQIYLDKLQDYTTKEEERGEQEYLDKNLLDMRIATELNTTTNYITPVEEMSLGVSDVVTQSTESVEVSEQEDNIQNLEKEKNTFLSEMEKGLEKFCRLFSISKVQYVSNQVDKVEYIPTEEDIKNVRRYEQETSQINKDVERLVDKDALHLLFSLDDIPRNLKDDFLHGVVELMPYLEEADQLNIMNILTSAFMGTTTDNNKLKDAIFKLSDIGIKNYKFKSIDKLYAIMIAFFYAEEDDVQ